MATVSEVLEAATAHSQTRVKLYVWNDTTSAYVDFSNRFEQDRLKRAAVVTHVAEGKYEQPVTKAIKIESTNEDRFWDGDPETAYDPWEGRRVQLRIWTPGASAEEALGTFRIALDGITTDTGAIAKLKLEPLTEALARADADEFKNGQQKHENRSWLYLISELLRTEYHDASGDLPSTYEIPTDPRFTYPDGNKHFSSMGKPPQWDGSSWNDDNTDYARAVAYDEDNDILYVGIGANLWKYDPSVDLWEDLGEDTGLGSGATVQEIFVSDNSILVLRYDEIPTVPAGTTTLYVNLLRKSAETWATTGRTSFADFYSGRYWTFDGYADGGDRARGHWNNQHPGSDPWDYGRNIPTPFEQYVREAGVGGTVDRLSSATATLDMDYNSAKLSGLPVTMYEYYAGFVKKSNTTVLRLRIAYGNKHNIFVRKQAGAFDFYVWIARYDSSGEEYNIYRLTLDPDISPVVSSGLISGATDYQIHSLITDATGANIGYIEMVENSIGSTLDLTMVKYVSATTPEAATLVFSSTSLAANSFITDIMVWEDFGSYTDVVYCKRLTDNLDEYPEWQLCIYTTTGSLELVKDNSMGYFQFLKRSTSGGQEAYYYTNSATGAVKRWADFYSGSNDISWIDGGLTPISEAPYIGRSLAEDLGTDDFVLYACAYPFHDPEFQLLKPEGKYHLWQYTTKHSGRVDLGDFDGMNKLQAISELCSAYEHVVYVDTDGDFVVEPRVPTAAPTETIEESRWTWGWTGIKKLKSAEIINFYQGIPYESSLIPMETDVRLTPQSQFNGVVEAAQVDTRRRSVKLRCMRGGTLGSGSNTGSSWWDFRTFYDELTTRLGTAYSGGTSVTVQNVQDIAVDDLIRVHDSEERTITAVTPATNVLTINSAFGSSYEINSEVHIAKANENKWSSQGITELTNGESAGATSIDVDDASNIAVGNYILFLDKDAEKREVTAVDYETNILTVAATTSLHVAGTDIGVVIIFGNEDEAYFVGGQGITLSIISQPYDDEIKNVTVGDLIEFRCHGMELRQAKGGGKVRVSDYPSIKDHGKRKPKKGRVSRFLTYRPMEFKYDAKVTRYATRKRRYRVTCPLTLGRRLYNTFYLKSEDFFPDESDNKLAVIIQEVHVDIEGHTTAYIVEEQ